MKNIPTTVHITAKCSDMCVTTIEDENGKLLAEHDGYVPSFMPEQHWGDYVILEIDIATGKILNWKVDALVEVKKFVKDNRVK